MYRSDIDLDLDQFDKTTWSLVGSGMSISILYFLYVGWIAVTTGRLVLHVSIDLQWTELVAAYPLLVGIAIVIGYVIGLVIGRTESAGGWIKYSNQEPPSDRS